MTLDVVHHKNSHAFLNQFFLIEVASLLHRFLLYAHLLLLENALIQGLKPEPYEFFTLRLFYLLSNLFSFQGLIMDLLE